MFTKDVEFWWNLICECTAHISDMQNVHCIQIKTLTDWQAQIQCLLKTSPLQWVPEVLEMYSILLLLCIKRYFGSLYSSKKNKISWAASRGEVVTVSEAIEVPVVAHMFGDLIMKSQLDLCVSFFHKEANTIVENTLCCICSCWVQQTLGGGWLCSNHCAAWWLKKTKEHLDCSMLNHLAGGLR